MAELVSLFVIGVLSLIIEPPLSRLDRYKKYAGYAKMGSLSLLILAILSLIASIPCILFELKWPIIYSLLFFTFMIARYGWQYFIDIHVVEKVKVGYLITYGAGGLMLGIFLYYFVGMALFGATIVNC